ncbi:MAG TPA: hypothetical protein VFQ07_17810 [Candidatus Polarisedimenticolia bacterium]|nr:hypothetical protein [Candidatus Polarisedimenticolia bacterium]
MSPVGGLTVANVTFRRPAHPRRPRRSGGAAPVKGGFAVTVVLLLATWTARDARAATFGAASLTVTAGGGLTASTYNTGSFVLDNVGTQAVRIVRVRLDLSTALLPDLVFDPLGLAGDTVAKCLTPDANALLVGFVPPADPCAGPFSVPHDGGYQALDLVFTDFRPGRSFTFSVDVDPSAIRGATAPGPGESGSVSGLEMTGATIEVTFDDQAILKAPLFPIAGDDGGSRAIAGAAAIPAVAIAILGAPALPATLPSAAQTVRLTGAPGTQARLLRAEGSLETAGLPGNGFDVEPFEADTVVQVEQWSVTLNASGIADIPVTLTRAGPDAGLNFFVAAPVGAAGRTGPLSAVLLAAPESCTFAPARSPQLFLQGNDVLWTPLPGATTYDVVRGDLASLRATHGRYDLATTGCPGFAVSGTSLTDPSVPGAGGAWFYLARGRSCGGTGTYDDASGWGQAAPRDPGIESAPAACP